MAQTAQPVVKHVSPRRRVCTPHTGLGTPPRLYNQIVRRLALANEFTVEQNARLFALVNAAMGDAGILA